MKITNSYKWLLVFILMVGNSYAQQNLITIDKSKTTVGEVLEFLEYTTKYNFVYKVKSVDLNRQVLINIDEGKIEDILNLLFVDSEIEYLIKKRQIILKKKTSTPSNSNLPIVDNKENISINGEILDKASYPLIGVNIIEQNTTNGTVSNFDGKFSLNVSNTNAILIFSYLGYVTKTLPLNGTTNLTVILNEISLALEEVIIIGYGTQKKRDVSGAISSIRKEDLEDNVFTSVAQTLQGRASGVYVTQASGEPGGGLDVYIRGLNSLSGNGQPLYVIDGIPLSLDIQAENDNNFTETNPIAALNPDDIESIEILKDASATSIYGSRASNGVILISTKSAKVGKIQVTGRARTSVIFGNRAYDLLNAPQYNQVRNDAVLLDNPTETFDELIASGAIPYPNIYINGQGTDFMEELLRTSYMSDYALSLSGGNTSYSQLLSLSFNNQEGTIIDSKFNRANLRYNSKLNITNRWSLTTNMQLNYMINQRIVNSARTGITGVVFNAFRIDPNKDLFDEDDDYLDEDEDGSFIANPISNALYDDTVLENKDVILGLNNSYNLSNNFVWTTRFGFTHRLSNNSSFADTRTARGRQDNGRLYDSNAIHTAVALESFLNYNKAFGNYNLSALIGVGYEDFVTKRNAHRYVDFTFDTFGADAIQLANEINLYNSSKTNNTLQSGFFRLGYSFKDKYILTINGRADGSSKFINGTPWGFFPSVAIAWNMKKESFLKEFNALSQFKLRASYGITGSQSGVDPLASQSVYIIDKIGLSDDNLYTATFPTGIPNKDLTWETSNSINLGLDFGLLNNRIRGSVEYYERITRNLLNNIPIPPQTGFNTIALNRGSLYNKGLEIQLNIDAIRRDNFKWNTSFNWSTNKTILKDYGSQEFINGPLVGANFFSEQVSINYVGDEIGKFYGYNIIGLIQIDDLEDYENGDFTPKNDANGNPVFVSTGNNRPGNWKFEDINGDGFITIADKKIIGNPNPDFFFGWNNNFYIGDFKISAFVQGSIGNDILNVNKGFTGVGWSGGNSSQEWYHNRWTVDNQHNNVNFPSNQNYLAVSAPNSVYIEDGGYIRLRNLTFKYDIPNKKGASNLSVYATGSNLLTWTKYTGPDPEVNTNRGNAFSRGVDYSAYPRAKVLSLGLDFNF